LRRAIGFARDWTHDRKRRTTRRASLQARRLPGDRTTFNQRRGHPDGSVWQQGVGKGREGDARAQARHAEERPLRQDGEEQEAGDRDRPVGGAAGRRQSAGEEERRGEEGRRRAQVDGKEGRRAQVDRSQEHGPQERSRKTGARKSASRKTASRRTARKSGARKTARKSPAKRSS
jgi:hypothetical protein